MIIRRLKMAEANKIIKSKISGVERVLVRGKGWIPVGEVKEANELKFIEFVDICGCANGLFVQSDFWNPQPVSDL
jgi:hypothetical protein